MKIQLDNDGSPIFCCGCSAQIDYCDCREQAERMPNVLDAFSIEPSSSKLSRVQRAPKNWGRFDGQPLTTWSPDGQSMILLQPYTYIDPREIKWTADRGMRVDGASIPRPFWTLIGSPYRGKYRLASVVHDAYCVERTRTWEATHFMFYQAMMASGVAHLKAKAMYYAVYHFGPKWHVGQVKGYDKRWSGPQEVRSIPMETVNKVARFIARTDPTIKEIEAVNPNLLGPH